MNPEMIGVAMPWVAIFVFALITAVIRNSKHK